MPGMTPSDTPSIFATVRSRSRASRATVSLLALLAITLLAGLVGAGATLPKQSDPATLQEQLGGAERYLTHLSTDKPIYRTGERVHVRGVMLGSADRTPLPKDRNNEQAWVEIRGPKGDIVAGGRARIEDSVFGFAWAVPDDQPGGEYTVKVTPSQGDAPASAPSISAPIVRRP